VQKSRPQVDFLRVQGPFYKITEITRNNELFYKGKIMWTGSTRDGLWPGHAVHCGPEVARTKGSGVRWRAHWILGGGGQAMQER
jgi:hypothetical protein